MSDFMKVDTVRLERAGLGEEKPGPQQPDKDLVQRFQDSMETLGKDREGRTERTDKDLLQRFHEPMENRGKDREGRTERHDHDTMQRFHEPMENRGKDREGRTERHDSDTMQRFREPMENRGKDREGRLGDTPTKTPGNAPDDDATGQMPSLPLNDLFSGRMPSITPGAIRPEAPMPPAELAERLVERILVGQTKDGGQEVRLRLGPDVMPGTEIRMTKGPDGILQVVLVTDNASSFQTLVAAQSDLKARLERLDSPVRIDITSESGAEDNDSNRRSRGWVPETDEPR